MIDNITLIGMPGSGKSSVGRALAGRIGYQFLDVDREIERRYGMKLSAVLDQYGDDGFRTVESEVNASLQPHHTVLAPGGSVVYGQRAMEHLRSIGAVVYLRLSCPLIAERLGNLHDRGVTIRPGQSFEDLYNERCPLYERYAHIAVDCEGLGIQGVTAEILRRLQGFSLGEAEGASE